MRIAVSWTDDDGPHSGILTDELPNQDQPNLPIIIPDQGDKGATAPIEIAGWTVKISDQKLARLFSLCQSVMKSGVFFEDLHPSRPEPKRPPRAP